MQPKVTPSVFADGNKSVTVLRDGYDELRWCSVLDVICKLQSLFFVVRLKVSFISTMNNPSWMSMFVPLAEFVCGSALVINGGRGGITHYVNNSVSIKPL